MVASHFYLHSGKQKNSVGWWGTTVILFLVKQFSGGNGSVKGCVAVMQQPVFFAKFGKKSSRVFMQSP
jgi:hypothetical protein